MFRKKADAAITSSRARPRSRSFSENPTDYLGLDDDVSAARRQYQPAHNDNGSGSTCRARSRSRGPKSNSGSRRGRSLSRGRRSNNGSNACTNSSKGGSFLETLRGRGRSRSRSRPRPSGANQDANVVDPNERWQSIVKTTGILSSQPNKQHDEMNVRSENGFVGARSGVDGRIVQGSRLPPAPPTTVPASNDTRRSERQARSNIRPERQGQRPIPPQRTKRTAVSKSQTEHIRPASSSSSSSSRSKAVSAVCNRTKVAAPKPQPSGRQTTTAQYRQKPRRRHSFDGISDPRILDLEDELGGVEDCHEEFGDHHTVATASVRTASSHERSRKSSLGNNSRRLAGSSGRSSASVGRPRGVQRPSPPLRRDDQQVPDASRSAPSMLMSHRPMPSGAASVRSRDSRASSRRSAPVVSSSRRHAGEPVPTVDSIRLRARQQREVRSNRLKHSQQSMDDFRPPGLPVDDQPIPAQQQQVNYSAPAEAANGDQGHFEALKDHEGPSGGTVPRPITRAASRGRGRGRREYYQDNDDDDLMKRSHRSLGRSCSRSISRRARKEQRRAEREERAERMMRRRASSMSRRCSSKDDVTDDSLGNDEEEDHRSKDGHQKEEVVVNSGSTLAASNYAKDASSRSTTKPWAEEYLNLPGTNSSDDEREWQVDKVNQCSPAAPVDFSMDDMNRNEAATETDAGIDDMNDLQKRLMRLAAGRNRRAESKSEHANTRHPQQEISKHHDALQNSFASAVAIEDIDEDVFSPRHRHPENIGSQMSIDQQRNQNANSLHSSASTTEGALDGSLHFDGERIDHSGNEKHQSNHRCILEDPFGLLDPDDNSSNSEQFKTADGWVKRNYEGGKAA